MWGRSTGIWLCRRVRLAFANGEAIDSNLVCSLCSQARQCSRSHLSEYQSKLPVTTCISIGLEQFPPTAWLAVTVNAKGCR